MKVGRQRKGIGLRSEAFLLDIERYLRREMTVKSIAIKYCATRGAIYYWVRTHAKEIGSPIPDCRKERSDKNLLLTEKHSPIDSNEVHTGEPTEGITK